MRELETWEMTENFSRGLHECDWRLTVLKQVVVGIRGDWTPRQGLWDDGMRFKSSNGQIVVDLNITIECVDESKCIGAAGFDSHGCCPKHGAFPIVCSRPGESYTVPLTFSI